MTSIERSAIFTIYNQLRPLARSGQLDAGRLNRGLGVAQRKHEPQYYTTSTACDCPDAFFRPLEICKHRLAFIMTAAARSERRARDAKDLQLVPATFSATGNAQAA